MEVFRFNAKAIGAELLGEIPYAEERKEQEASLSSGNTNWKRTPVVAEQHGRKGLALQAAKDASSGCSRR